MNGGFMRTVYLIVFAVIIALIAGCTGQRLSEDEYIQKANDCMARGDLTDAIAFYESAIKYYPESENVEKYEKKLFDIVFRAYEKHSGTPKGDKFMAKALSLAGEQSDSLREWLKFKKALDLQKESPKDASEIFENITKEGYYRIAQVYIARNDFKGAIDTYKKLLEVYPDDPDNYKPLFMIGFNYSEYLKDYENARIYFQRVVDEYPESELATSATFMLDNMGKDPEEIIFMDDEEEGDAKDTIAAE